MSRGRGRRDNDLIGQTVRISQGPYKGEWVFWLGRSCGSPRFPHQMTVATRRLHRGGEGCNRVDGSGGAALYLPDHLSGSPAPDHCVSRRTGNRAAPALGWVLKGLPHVLDAAGVHGARVG